MSGQIIKVHLKLHRGKPNKLGRVPIMAQWKIAGIVKKRYLVIFFKFYLHFFRKSHLY